jgi:hypothetical protein
MFLGFREGTTYVKMKRLGKKKSFACSWEERFFLCEVF